MSFAVSNLERKCEKMLDKFLFVLREIVCEIEKYVCKISVAINLGSMCHVENACYQV